MHYDETDLRNLAQRLNAQNKGQGGDLAAALDLAMRPLQLAYSSFFGGKFQLLPYIHAAEDADAIC